MVFGDRLGRLIGTAAFDRYVDQDRAVWSPRFQISDALETSLPEIFAFDYGTRLEAARERSLDT